MVIYHNKHQNWKDNSIICNYTSNLKIAINLVPGFVGVYLQLCLQNLGNSLKSWISWEMKQIEKFRKIKSQRKRKYLVHNYTIHPPRCHQSWKQKLKVVMSNCFSIRCISYILHSERVKWSQGISLYEVIESFVLWNTSSNCFS